MYYIVDGIYDELFGRSQESMTSRGCLWRRFGLHRNICVVRIFRPQGASRPQSVRPRHQVLDHMQLLVIVIVISKLLKRYSKAKRTRAPAYSRALRALRRIKGGFPKGGQE